MIPIKSVDRFAQHKFRNLPQNLGIGERAGQTVRIHPSTKLSHARASHVTINNHIVRLCSHKEVSQPKATSPISHNFDSIHTPTPSPSAIFDHRVASSLSLASHACAQSATPSTNFLTSSRVCPACKHTLTRDVPTGTVGHVMALVYSGCGSEERYAARKCG